MDEKERRIIEALDSANQQISIRRRSVAKSILGGVNETYPNDRRVTKLLADLEILDKHWQKALDLLIPAGFDRSNDGGSRLMRVGYLLTKVGRHQEARKLWSPDLVVRLGYPEWNQLLPNAKTTKGLEASWLLALTFEVLGKGVYENTIQMMEEVLKLAPGNQIAAGYLGEVGWNRREYAAAVRYCDMALKGCPAGLYRDGVLDTREKAAAMIR